MSAKFEFWFHFYMAEGLMVLSLAGMWMAARRSPGGLKLVLLHFLAMLVGLIGIVVIWPLGAPIEVLFGLWLFFVVPGVFVVAWESLLRLGWGFEFLRRGTEFLVRKVLWSLAWLAQRQRNQRNLQALADAGCGVMLRRWSPRLVWLTEEMHIDVGFAVDGDQGYTVLTFRSGDRLPLDLSLVPLDMMKARSGKVSLSDLDYQRSFQECFATDWNWSPYAGMWVTYPRLFGQVVPGLCVEGRESDVIALFGPANRESLADWLAEGSLRLEGGMIHARLVGFLEQEALTEAIARLRQLGDALSLPQDAYPAAVLANLRAEADPGLRLRLLEYLFDSYGDSEEAAAARAEVEAEIDDPHIRLLCFIYDVGKKTEGSLQALATWVKERADESDLAPHLRMCGWKFLKPRISLGDRQVFVEEIMARDDDLLSAEIAYDVGMHGYQALEVPMFQACWAWALRQQAPFDVSCGNAILALYRSDMAEHRDGDAHVIALMQQPEEALRDEAIQLLGQKGSAETIGLLYQAARKKGNIGPEAAAFRETTRKIIDLIHLRLGPQERGQLTLLDDVVAEGGMLSLSHDGEAAGALSLAQDGGGLSLVNCAEEGGLSLASDDASKHASEGTMS